MAARGAPSSAVPGRARTLVGVGLAVVAGGAIVFAGGRILLKRLYFDEVAALRESIAAQNDRLASRRRSLRAADDVRAEVDGFVSRTLGGTEEAVDHAIRRELLDIANDVGLVEPKASTGRVRSVESPQRRAFPRTGIWRQLRDEADLVEFEAGVGGQATFAQAIDLVDRLDAAPWPKRIDVVRLMPKRGGEFIEVRIALTTAFIPGREPAEIDPDIAAAAQPDPDDPEVLALAAVRRDLKQRVIERDLFRLPAPEIVVQAPPDTTPDPTPPPDPGPPPFPWSAWTLTGVADGPGGPEAWLRHGPDGRSVVLTTGADFESVTITGILEDRVVFADGEDRTEIIIGGTLEPLATGRRRGRGRGRRRGDGS